MAWEMEEGFLGNEYEWLQKNIPGRFVCLCNSGALSHFARLSLYFLAKPARSSFFPTTQGGCQAHM